MNEERVGLFRDGSLLQTFEGFKPMAEAKQFKGFLEKTHGRIGYKIRFLEDTE